jgi:2-oxoglutarate ferredoxin oxidoreductase subunit alpha
VPVLAPDTIGEAMEIIPTAFEIAEHYRTPVMVLADGILGQAMEPVTTTFRTPEHRTEDWHLTGADGRPPRVIKSLHLKADELEEHNRHLQAKYAAISEAEVRWTEEQLEDAELAVVAYGTAARIARTAIAHVREGGLRVGLFRPISLWPYPAVQLRERVAGLRGVLVVELSAGQMVEDVRLAVEGRVPVAFHGRTGGNVPTPGEIAHQLARLYALTVPPPGPPAPVVPAPVRMTEGGRS